jgi:hypothetical protein
VAAKTQDTSTGWAAPYDYPALANVTDYILVMAYDWHWANSGPGPVAPIDKVRAAARYTLQKVPPEKVIWGVGVYGYNWGMKPDGTRDEKPGEYLGFTEADALAAAPGSEIGYDEVRHAPWIRYERDSLPREVWYENKRSFDTKLLLIQEMKMAGFGIWRLGHEDPAIWKTVATTQPPWACKAVKAPAKGSGKLYFAETGHTLGGVFLKYWQARGGLPVYGYPITEEFWEPNPVNGRWYKVQYFERNRFEHHPENKAPNDVLLGLLGVQVTKSRTFPPLDDPAPGADTVYFPQVRHTLNGPFLRHWQKLGGLAQFGYPISEPVLEVSPTNGQTYTVQYMQRARFEYHAEYQGTDSEVLLGLLGRDVVPCE